MRKEVAVFAPGTVANLGPGFDCLGLCLDELGDRITIRPAASDQIIVTGRDAGDVPTSFQENCAGLVADAVRTSLGHRVALEITLERSLPLSGGLGASAASSVGAALATALLLGHDATLAELIMWSLVGEEAVAGRHLDNLAPCLMGGLTFSTFNASGLPLVRSYPLGKDYFLALVTPRAKVNTKEARARLPDTLSKDAYLDGISALSGTLCGLLSGDDTLLRCSLRDPFAVPARKPLIPSFEQAWTAAQRAGALATSISGSGPTLFALCSDVDVASDVVEAWVQVYASLGASSHVCKASLPMASSLDDTVSFLEAFRSKSSSKREASHERIQGGVRVLSLS